MVEELLGYGVECEDIADETIGGYYLPWVAVDLASDELKTVYGEVDTSFHATVFLAAVDTQGGTARDKDKRALGKCLGHRLGKTRHGTGHPCNALNLVTVGIYVTVGIRHIE